MIRILLFVSLCCLPQIIFASNIKLSPKAEILVITCGAGQEALYAAFGHSAVRVYDPENRLDKIYNYGIFSFNNPNFYADFAKGYLNYRLGTQNYRNFRYQYVYFNRFLHEQRLNLTTEQKQQYFDFLEWNAKPENQYYLYDYFYDNCATRVRDGLKTVFGDSLVFDTTYVETDYTIRELTDLYLGYQPWGDFGIDLALGLPMDKVAAPNEYMFLPDYIEQAFNHAYIYQNGEKKPLVKSTYNSFEPKPQQFENTFFTPLAVFIIFLLVTIVVTFLDYRQKKCTYWFDVLVFGFIGLVGLLLFFLWFFTDHKAAASNFNLLWAWPTHFPIVFLLFKKRKPSFFSGYFLGVSVLSGLLLVFWFVLPQMLHYALIPLVMALGLRGWHYFRVHKTTKITT